MAVWNVDVPKSEYYGPLPYNPKGVVSSPIEPLIRELECTRDIAIDTETTGLSINYDAVLYWSLAWGRRRATLHVSQLPYFAHIFNDPSKCWIFANAKFDAHMLANTGVPFIAGVFHCTQVMHSLLYEERSHRLKDMAAHLLGWRWSDFQDTFGKIRKGFSPTELIKKAEAENFPLLVEYAANDAWGTLGCYNNLAGTLQCALTHSLFREKPPYIETLWDLFIKIEAPYTKVLWKNERNGVLIDKQELERSRPIAEQEIKDVEKEICKQAGAIISPTSDNDLRKYFFTHKGYSPTKMTKGGTTGKRLPSVDKGYLQHLVDTVQDPVAKLVLKHKNLSKLKGTYLDGIYNLLDSKGRVHTKFNQDIARTGRLSSSEPNLQNIPNVDKDKWKIRSAFIASPGYSLIVADYSQLEMRLLACASLQPEMIQIFLENKDIHMGNASMMYGTPYDDLKKAKKIDKMVKQGELPESEMTKYVLECLEQRASSKNIGFGQQTKAEVKPTQNGETYGQKPTAIPCCLDQVVYRLEGDGPLNIAA